MRRTEWWPPLAGLAEDQGGCFTAAQARLEGAQRSQLLDLIERGEIERVTHGVYRIVGTSGDLWLALRAAWLALAPERSAGERLSASDPGGVVSHRSAARLLELGDVAADRMEFTLSERHRTRNRDVMIRRGRLAPEEWIVHAGLPVTTPLATVRLLAADRLDGGHLAGVARDAAVRYDVPLPRLAEVLEPFVATYGHTTGRELVDDLLRIAGIPATTLQIAEAARKRGDD